VPARAAGARPGHGLEGAVAGLVAVGIVDILEVVDIEHDHADWLHLGPVQQVGQMEVEGALVGGSGQGIAQGLLAQALAGLFHQGHALAGVFQGGLEVAQLGLGAGQQFAFLGAVLADLVAQGPDMVQGGGLELIQVGGLADVLHQAAHLMERGVGAAAAVSSVTTFSATSGVVGLLFGLLLRRIGVKMGLAISGVALSLSSILIARVTTPVEALTSAALFGAAMGGIHTALPVAWADYFGRRSFGAIRGVALAIQVTAQASGPLLSGVLRDATGDYSASLAIFAALGALAAVSALLVGAPRPKT
jgi:MFS family permease